jgi:hypothetical protein
VGGSAISVKRDAELQLVVRAGAGYDSQAALPASVDEQRCHRVSRI